MKILTFDIETSPHTGMVWQKYDTNVIWFAKYGGILSIAWKWNTEKKGHVIGLPDFKYRAGKENDEEVLEAFSKVINEADIICYQNGDRFDLPYINARLLFHRLPPLKYFPPSQRIDTLKVFRRHFRFPANNLDEVCAYLGIGRKLKTDKDLWRECLEGNMTAWRHMKEYNLHDVVLTEDVMKLILPFAPETPNFNVFSNTIIRCPNVACGSTRIQHRGIRYTKTSQYEDLRCYDCHRSIQGKREPNQRVYR